MLYIPKFLVVTTTFLLDYGIKIRLFIHSILYKFIILYNVYMAKYNESLAKKISNQLYALVDKEIVRFLSTFCKYYE